MTFALHSADQIRQALAGRGGSGAWADAAQGTAAPPPGLPDVPAGHIRGFFDYDRMGFSEGMHIARDDNAGLLHLALFDIDDPGQSYMGSLFSVSFHTFNDGLGKLPTPRLDAYASSIAVMREHFPHVLDLLAEVADDGITIADFSMRLLQLGLADLSEQPSR